MENVVKKAKNIVIWGAQNYFKETFPKLLEDVRPQYIIPDGTPADEKMFGLTVLDSIDDIKALEDPCVLIARVPALAAKRVANILRENDISFDHINHYIGNKISLAYLEAMGIYDYVNYYDNRVTFSPELYKTDRVSISFVKKNNFEARNNTIVLGSVHVYNSLVISYYGNNGYVSFGDATKLHAVSVSVTTNGRVEVGDDCLFSHDITLEQNDAHMIFDLNTEKRINKNKNIRLGNHVWIGRCAHMLGGFGIGNNSVIGAYTVSSRNFELANCVVAGSPAKVVRENILWSRDDQAYDYDDFSQCEDQNAMNYI